MRIGLFTNAYKPEISGVVASISTFRDELVRQGHAVYIFAPEASDYEDEEYGVFRYPALRLTSAVNLPLAIPVSPFINWVTPRLKLDILHSQHPVLIGEEAVTFARDLNLPHVFTHHSQYEEYAQYIPFNQNIVKTLTREVVRGHLIRSVKVITPTKSIQDLLSAQYPAFKDRLVTLPSPINLDLYHPQHLNPAPIRCRYRLEDKFTFISVGRLAKEKKFPVLFEAFKEITISQPQTHLILVGDGPIKKDLQKLAQELDLTDQITFTGFVDHAEMPHYLAAAQAFAFASTTETQGLVMVEGMAAGLPVVAVDAPGSRDVVQHEVNGLLTENSTSALARGMAHLVADPTRRQTLAAGALKTAADYAPSILTRRLVDCYQEAIQCYREAPLNYKRFSRDPEGSRQFPPQWLSDIAEDSVDSFTAFWQKISRYWKFDDRD